jgi:hypothetical protein
MRSARSGSLDVQMLPKRRRTSDLAINAPSLPHLATRTTALGLGFGDRFGGFQGRSGSFEEMVLQAEEPGELQGKRAIKRVRGIT